MQIECQESYSEAIRQVNLRNAEFWEEQKRLREQRMAKRLVLRKTVKTIKFNDQSVPIYQRPIFEEVLRVAEEIVKREMTHRGLLGGQTPKADLLTILIRKIADSKPDISDNELAFTLKKEVGKGIIEAMDVRSYIEYRNDDGQLIRCPISALKHRLSRARKLCSAKHAENN